MKFLKKIWTTIKIYFVGKKKKSNIKVYHNAKATIEKGIDKEEILTKASNATNDEERKEILKPLIEFESAKQIVVVIEQEPEILSEPKPTKRRKKLYDLHELEDEIKLLQSSLTLLDLKKSSIKEVTNPDTSLFDNRIDTLFSLLSKNKIDDKIELSDCTVSAFDKDFKQLERLLQEKSTLKKHGNREKEKKKQREIYKSNIKKELNNLDSLIGQNKLNDAKLLINRLSKSLKPDYKRGIERLAKATEKLKEKELDIFRKRQAELLKQQKEKAERIRIEQERILEQQRIARELAEEKRKIEEAKKFEKKDKLKALLRKKFNWREFQRVLQENGITAFYHFTDYHNLKSIKENNGLYSWHFADSNGIIINFPGGDTLSRDLDKRYGLQDYVRVSFCTNHPMQYRLEKRGRNLALLEVDIEVAYYENTIFCNINATDSSHSKGTELIDLERIRFSATKKRFVSREDPDFKPHQAEVLVKTWIPLENITNINNFA
ncbi:DarT ssDNA thymidine ADP-ribosyltransferase family protein [Aequorivita todarodis]|uniref:DarT ssDNA thymidine ADP-ribosyltransferase family protein n=1 Tax=Aequorivita todarodis TaxID=2036821 RepID=UPI0023500104|nr:DarT ssDNA thymidine ADP-ribosyltransferase family protein [Aequorivita todarodis]MDC8002121.1 DarT ssDNA thymidine ADP-ribosyltransferase family protein [Aequorivita todarodis]